MVYNLSLLLVSVMCWGNLIRLNGSHYFDPEVFISIFLLGASIGIIMTNIIRIIYGRFLKEDKESSFFNNRELR